MWEKDFPGRANGRAEAQRKGPCPTRESWKDLAFTPYNNGHRRALKPRMAGDNLTFNLKSTLLVLHPDNRIIFSTKRK
jgi:hypothetical protein